ncbi:MAG: hypothetical protein HC836_41045 [Richelia sp. RM2_1_2]|nr:hypothetical protein [Richelia sp. RM2_1_2]
MDNSDEEEISIDRLPEQAEENLKRKFLDDPRVKESDNLIPNHQLVLAQQTSLQKLLEDVRNDYDKYGRKIDERISAKVWEVNNHSNKKDKTQLREEIMEEKEMHRALRLGLESDAYLNHPDSIVALRYFPKQIPDHGCRFEAISNNVFGNEGDSQQKTSSITIPLSRKFVKEHFDKAYVEKVMAMSSEDFLYLHDIQRNATRETRNLAENIQQHFKNNRNSYTLDLRGEDDEGIHYIMCLKVETEFSGPTLTQSPKATWYVKSYSKVHLRAEQLQNRYKTKVEPDSTDKNGIPMKYSEWLEIDYDMLSDENCVGNIIPDKLLSDVKKTFRTLVQNRSKCNQPLNTSVKTTITSDIHRFDDKFSWKTEPAVLEAHPQYCSKQKQIAAVRYDLKRSRFYGQIVNSVRSGRREYEREVPLDDDWVTANITESFIQAIKRRAKKNKYLWIPAGNSNKKPYPFEYNKQNPKIKFQQGDRQTCASSSLASCLHALGYIESAVWVEDYGRKYIESNNNDPSIILSALVNNLQSNQPFLNKRFKVTQIKLSSFDIYENKDKHIYLIQPLCSDGGISHAITIHNGLIYDSNLKYAVELNKDNLEYCIDSCYIGIHIGYALAPQPMGKRNKHIIRSIPSKALSKHEIEKIINQQFE